MRQLFIIPSLVLGSVACDSPGDGTGRTQTDATTSVAPDGNFDVPVHEATDFALESGAFTLVADLQVLPLTLHFIVDLAVDPTSGACVAIATQARLAETEPPLPTTTAAPQVHVLELGGFAFVMACQVFDDGPGRYHFVTLPTDVTLIAAVPMTFDDLRIEGSLFPGGATADDCPEVPAGGCAGNDEGSGVLSTSGGSFGRERTPLAPINSAWQGYGFSVAELDALVGLPRVCAPVPCAAMIANGGDCHLPGPWDPNHLERGDYTSTMVCPE